METSHVSFPQSGGGKPTAWVPAGLGSGGYNNLIHQLRLTVQIWAQKCPLFEREGLVLFQRKGKFALGQNCTYSQVPEKFYAHGHVSHLFENFSLIGVYQRG